MTGELSENQLICYPVPKGIAVRKDFSVSVRLAATDEWKEVPCYEVKVDMHDVRRASMAYFDFNGRVDVKIRFNNYMDIYQVDIRPKNRNIQPRFTEREIYFELEQPENLSIEINQDRFHNLHLFAGAIMQNTPDTRDERVEYVAGSPKGAAVYSAGELEKARRKPKEERIIYFGPGIHYIEECVLKIPSNTSIYLEGGAVVIGGFVCERVNNVKIFGRGVVYQADFNRYSALRGVRISHSREINIEGITFINPPHYTLYIGGSEAICVKGIKSFSCEGWSDGIDIMSSRNVTIEDVFMRNSDDCIALYGRRWDYNGDTRDIQVKHSVLWADVAHPTNIGCHGDYENDGNVIENIVFSDIDILEHHEPQMECLGCLCINAGDKNTVRNVRYEDIRIEHMEHGKLLDLKIICGKYNPAPGKRIEKISFKDIYYSEAGEETSQIQGMGEKNQVCDIVFENLVVRGEKITSAEKGNIYVGEYAYNVIFH